MATGGKNESLATSVHNIPKQTLEQALLPAMETFVTAAHAHAVSKGRSEVSDADFNAILAKYKKVRAGKGKK